MKYIGVWPRTNEVLLKVLSKSVLVVFLTKSSKILGDKWICTYIRTVFSGNENTVSQQNNIFMLIWNNLTHFFECPPWTQDVNWLYIRHNLRLVSMGTGNAVEYWNLKKLGTKWINSLLTFLKDYFSTLSKIYDKTLFTNSERFLTGNIFAKYSIIYVKNLGKLLDFTLYHSR